MKRSSKVFAIVALAAAFASSAAVAACSPDDVMTYGATSNATIAGHPIISLEAVGGVTIRHRHAAGFADGGFQTMTVCDHETAASVRSQLEAELRKPDRIIVGHELPAWLEQ